jgi:nicotinamide-nucleotide amidase
MEASQAATVVSVLRASAHTVACAESLTGGQVAADLTAVPGASEVFRGAIVSYAPTVKEHVLGVPSHVISTYGAVSAECAAAMAVGVRGLMQATYGISTTGVAGPAQQEDKPVGTAFVAIAGSAGVLTEELSFTGTRAEIQEQTKTALFNLLLQVDTPR